MIESLLDRDHRTVTGVCLLEVGAACFPARRLWAESATVTMGRPSSAALREHLGSDAWQGKAGGYSLDEVSRSGWPVACLGDPEVVLGLPTRSILQAIERQAAEARA